MTADITGLGALRCLEALENMHQIVDSIKLVLPNNWKSERCATNRDDSIPSSSPYGAAKVFAFEITEITGNLGHVCVYWYTI